MTFDKDKGAHQRPEHICIISHLSDRRVIFCVAVGKAGGWVHENDDHNSDGSVTSLRSTKRRGLKIEACA